MSTVSIRGYPVGGRAKFDYYHTAKKQQEQEQEQEQEQGANDSVALSANDSAAKLIATAGVRSAQVHTPQAETASHGCPKNEWPAW